MMPPPFPFIAPYSVPPPPMPSDLTNFTDEELRALEGNERKNVEERIKLLRNIQVMLDAVTVLMNNYQIVSARSKPLINPTVGQTGATTTSNANPSSGEKVTPSTSSTGAAQSTSTKVDATKTEELPTTSAAAAAASKISTAPNTEVTTTVNAASSTPATLSTTETTTTTAVAKHNQVTIEDLGGEDHIDVQDSVTSAPSSSTTSPTTLIDSTAEHINELRKRRLKFLEERNKTSTE